MSRGRRNVRRSKKAAGLVKLVSFQRGTFTRASNASRRLTPDASRIEIVGNDVRVFEDLGNGLGPLLRLEKPYTEQLRVTGDPTSAIWSKTNATVAANVAPSPDWTGGSAVTNAWRLQATAAGLCSISQVPQGPSSAPGARFNVWLKAGTTTSASMEISDGTTTATQDLVLTTEWVLYTLPLGGAHTSEPVVTLRPHHAGLAAAAGDNILVFGPNYWSYGTVGLLHQTSFLPRVTAGVSRGVERLVYTEDEYDPRLRSHNSAFWWVPQFFIPDGNAPGADSAFFSCVNGGNEILWANSDSAVPGAANAVRLRESPPASFVNCGVGGPLTVALPFEPLLVFRDMVGGHIKVFGADAEGAEVLRINQPWDWSIAADPGSRFLRVGGRANDDGQHVLDGWISEMFLCPDEATAQVIFNNRLHP